MTETRRKNNTRSPIFQVCGCFQKAIYPVQDAVIGQSVLMFHCPYCTVWYLWQ